MNENFDFNPKNLNVISDKPTNKDKLNATTAKEESKENQDALKKKLEVLTTIPKKKYPFPMTANQEIGWDADTLYDAHRPKYSFNRVTYDECKFA